MPVFQFVTHTNDITYVTQDADGASSFVTDTSGSWVYSTQWPTQASDLTPEPTSSASPSETESSVSPSTSQQTSPENTPQQLSGTTSMEIESTSSSKPAATSSPLGDPSPTTTTKTDAVYPSTTSVGESSSQTPSAAATTTSDADSGSALQSTSSSIEISSSEPTTTAQSGSESLLPTSSSVEVSIPVSTSTSEAQTVSTPQGSSSSDISPTSSTTASEVETTSTSQGSSTSEFSSSPSTTASEGTTSSSEAPSSTSQSTSSSTSTQAQATTSQAKSVPDYIVYSPYSSSGACKDSSTVSNDLKDISSKGINKLRVYATDCNSLNTIQPVASDLGMKIIQGLWIGSSGLDNVDQSLSDLLSYTETNGWDTIESVVLGNEDVVDGYVSASDLVNKAFEVRSKLKSAGFSGNLLHAETTQGYLSNTELCETDAFDVIGLNAHSFFDASISAGDAGSFINGQASLVAEKCSTSKKVFITETGYPWKGDSNGNNTPSRENQVAAIDSILENHGSDCVILTTFDDMWKPPGEYGIEQYFGVISWI